MLAWIPAPDTPWWNVWNTVGTWVAGIGTIATVITALWLANRDNSVRLRVYAVVGLRIDDNYNPPRTSNFVWISVTNVGR